jgi:hypothetical protein
MGRKEMGVDEKMQELEPLKQWICDQCGELIQKPEHGCVEWLEDSGHHKFGFRIVHHAPHSPRRDGDGDCYYSKNKRGGDSQPTAFLGTDGLVRLTSWIDAGKEFDEPYPGPMVNNLREWASLVRRLHVPYYEEARLYFDQAHEDGNLGGANEVYFIFRIVD